MLSPTTFKIHLKKVASFNCHDQLIGQGVRLIDVTVAARASTRDG